MWKKVDEQVTLKLKKNPGTNKIFKTLKIWMTVARNICTLYSNYIHEWYESEDSENTYKIWRYPFYCYN